MVREVRKIQFVCGNVLYCRIVLSPYPLSSQESDYINTTTTNAFSATELTHAITRTFYGANEVFSSTHDPLSQAAGEIICSPNLSFPSCLEDRNGNNREEKLPPGFGNPTERGYVAAIIFTSAFCVVLMIVVVCIFREGKVMRMERRKEDPLFSRKPNGISGRINDGSGSDEDEDEVQVTSNRRASLEDNRDTVEPVTNTRAGFYQNRQQSGSSRRLRERSSVGHLSPGSGRDRSRPSVTYSEVLSTNKP